MAATTTWSSRTTCASRSELGRQKQSKIDIPFFSNTKIKDIAARTIKSDGSIVELAKQDIVERVVVKVSGLKLRTKTVCVSRHRARSDHRI